MLLLRFILFLALPFHLQAQNAHPELRAIIFEALDLTTDIRQFPDRFSPQQQAATLLARLGYVEDAENILLEYSMSKPSIPQFLWRSWVLYGPQQRMDQYLASLTDPNIRVGVLTAYASTLWRLGQKQRAKQTYLTAQALLPRVTILKNRTNATNAINQGLKYIEDDAPTPISTQTIPVPKRNPVPSFIGRFPITPNGFNHQTPIEREANSYSDEKLIQELYANLKAGDMQALDRIVSSADTPFQKAMAIASIQHIMNQYRLADLSEVCAKAIPSTDKDSRLAKAESLASAATVVDLANAKNRARALLLSAAEIAADVPQYPMGRIQVLVNIAIRQLSAGFDTDAETTWTRAIQFAQAFPSAPSLWAQRKPGEKYREDAFWILISEAVEFQQMKLATLAVDAWSASDKEAKGSLVSALLRSRDYPLALSTARSIPDRHLRARELLSVVSSWLDEIKAPDF